MARVLCDPSVPLELVRDVLAASETIVETSVPPWSGEDVVALVSFEPVTAGDLERLPGLRVIAAPSVGFDHVDVEAATRLGVWVCHVPDYCIEEMADHALALLLSLVRGVVELDRSVRAGGWDSKAAGSLRRVSDERLGVIGFGRIGRALAARARALGMEVCAHDPFLSDEEISAAGVRPAALDDLLRTSTAISIHAPLTPETRGLIGSRELALLPAGAYVVNVSRAGLVDTGHCCKRSRAATSAVSRSTFSTSSRPLSERRRRARRGSSSLRMRGGTASGRRRRRTVARPSRCSTCSKAAARATR